MQPIPCKAVTENEDSRFPHDLIIEVSDDYINTHTDPYGGKAKQVEPTCKCGHDLEYQGAPSWLDDRKIPPCVSHMRANVPAAGSNGGDQRRR